MGEDSYEASITIFCLDYIFVGVLVKRSYLFVVV